MRLPWTISVTERDGRVFVFNLIESKHSSFSIHCDARDLLMSGLWCHARQNHASNLGRETAVLKSYRSEMLTLRRSRTRK